MDKTKIYELDQVVLEEIRKEAHTPIFDKDLTGYLYFITHQVKEGCKVCWHEGKWRIMLPEIKIQGKKEVEGKLYYELSWEFIEEMAKRMANNKGDKYPLFNWKLPMGEEGIEGLRQATNRHHIEVMKGNYADGDEPFGHLLAYACNSMMLWEQLKNKTDENKI